MQLPSWNWLANAGTKRESWRGWIMQNQRSENVRAAPRDFALMAEEMISHFPVMFLSSGE